jgi:hypothetical protein
MKRARRCVRGVVMRGMSGNADAGTTEKDRINFRGDRDRESFFGPYIIPAICRGFLGLSAKDLARMGDAHPRAAEFWLSGRFEMPTAVVLEVVAEALRRDRAKRRAAKR